MLKEIQFEDEEKNELYDAQQSNDHESVIFLWQTLLQIIPVRLRDESKSSHCRIKNK